MVFHTRNKNELLVLTGSVYTFVAYLTAFTLEVLFIIDLARQNGEQLMSVAANPRTTASPLDSDLIGAGTLDQARTALDSMQAHITISCLAISVLFFVLFIASLILIVALIIKSTFMILIWMCIMTTLYIPEFGLVIYVSLFSWGIDTRNGQVELIFYLFRATLNSLFILKAHKLYKDWNYEKNFLRLKSGSSIFAGYDSPYFIGDSLSTTINPVFSTSTCTLNRYDQVRANYNSDHSTTSLDSIYHRHYDSHQTDLGGHQLRSTRPLSYSRDQSSPYDNSRTRQQPGYNPQRPSMGAHLSASRRNDSSMSINDNDSFADYELDLDYRTLTNQRSRRSDKSRRRPTATTTNRFDNDDDEFEPNPPGTLSRGPAGISYSTQSLDRRHLKDMDFALPEHVILRPLGHQPFEYLQRPGSSSNLNSTNPVNTQPATFDANRRSNQRPLRDDDQYRHRLL